MFIYDSNVKKCKAFGNDISIGKRRLHSPSATAIGERTVSFHSQTIESVQSGQYQQHNSKPDIQLGGAGPKGTGSDTMGSEIVELWQTWEAMRRDMMFPVLGGISGSNSTTLNTH